MQRVSWLRWVLLGVGCLVLFLGLGLCPKGEGLATSSVSAIELPYTLKDGAGFLWTVSDRDALKILSEAFDPRYGCFRLTIGTELFKSPQASLEMDEQGVVLGVVLTKIMGRGLKVTREVLVPRAREGQLVGQFIRFREVIENPSQSEVSISNLKLTCHLAPSPAPEGLQTVVTPSPDWGDPEIAKDDSYVALVLEPETFERGFAALPWKQYYGEGKEEKSSSPYWQCDPKGLNPLGQDDPRAWQVIEAEEERGKVARAGAGSEASTCQNPAIPDRMCTALVLQGFETRAGEVSFRRKVSSESWDTLQFFIDGELKGWWSGELDWEEARFPMGEGKHTFIWAYQKSRADCAGNDTAWIDDIQFPLRPSFLWAIFSPDGELKPTNIRKNGNTLTVEYSSLTIPAKDKIAIIHFGAQYKRAESDQVSSDAESLLRLEGLASNYLLPIRPEEEIGPMLSHTWFHSCLGKTPESIGEGTQLAMTGESICLQIQGTRLVKRQYADNLPSRFDPEPLTGEELKPELGEIAIEVVDRETGQVIVSSDKLAPPAEPGCVGGPCEKVTVVERCFSFYAPIFPELQAGHKYYFRATATPKLRFFPSPNWTLKQSCSG